MKWSWKIGEVSGIGVYVHATFLLLLGWVALSHWMEGRSLAFVAAGVGFILLLFTCVVLHEFGHALTAKKFGIKTRDITLLPIGGVARLERMPEDPKQELWVALAGPAVNVVIAGVLFIVLQFTGGMQSLSTLSVTRGPFLERLLIVNISLVLFNILPAFPMDGGRIVRALLAMRMDYMKATQIAAGLGQGMAFLFGFIGLFSNPFLVFIALFVWIGAAQEASMVQMRSALGGIPVSRAMLSDFRTLAPNDPLARAAKLILEGSQQDFPVMNEGEVVGLLTRSRLLVALAQQGQETLVSEVMERNFEAVDSSDMLETAFARLQNCQCPMLPVKHANQLVGLVTTENIGEFIMIQGALGAARGAKIENAAGTLGVDNRQTSRT
jgi:Zn-dependent protease/predicted transcriptional regulator